MTDDQSIFVCPCCRERTWLPIRHVELSETSLASERLLQQCVNRAKSRWGRVQSHQRELRAFQRRRRLCWALLHSHNMAWLPCQDASQPGHCAGQLRAHVSRMRVLDVTIGILIAMSICDDNRKETEMLDEMRLVPMKAVSVPREMKLQIGVHQYHFSSL
jgi:hypothetical protein